MKKFLLALLAVVCLTCLGLAAAACSAQYYTLYFVSVDGANVVCEIPSGYEVRAGYEVNFRVELDDDAEGSPEVSVNGKTIQADGKGNYSFIMEKETTVSVSNVFVTGRYAVIFDKGDADGNEYRVTYSAEYVDEDGILTKIDTENPDGTRVKAETEVNFTIDVSVYYGENPEFEVLANTVVLHPSPDGVYTTSVKDRVTISIQGLELEDSFLAREDGGYGTVSNPFRIEKPIDLYTMAYLLNSSFYYSQVYTAYYSLEADIDLKGEELYIIGAGMEYCFSGDFNGNGHTISNYVINAEAVSQTDFTVGFMTFIGMFGVAADAQIYDLNLKNFTCNVNAAPWDTAEYAEDYAGFFIGGVVAYGVGVNITNCTVSGSIRAAGGDSITGYIGGIIGFQASAYDGTRYYSTVRSCSTDMTIRGASGSVYTAGGIAGYVVSYGEAIPATIINCYSTGDVAGAMRTGGIVGTMSSYGSIINCYATGYVDANNRAGSTASGDFRYAYSGGIVGDLGTDAIVANCFFTGGVTATASSTAGASFQKAGYIAGNTGVGGANGGAYIESENGLIYNCVYVGSKDTITNDYIQNELGWSTADWSFTNGGYPTVNGDVASNSFTLTVSLINGSVAGVDEVEQSITDEYRPMAYWYMASVNIPEFLTADNGERSFGYYFDAELTTKVPNGFVPTADITLYASFADYGEVAGVYYLQWSESGSGKYIELKNDGTLIYRDGALSSISYYYYDGETITLRDTFIAIIDGLSADSYTSFKARVADGVMTIWDNAYYPASAPVTASKQIEGFGYGKYYGAGVEYVFNTDGTGVYTNGSNVQEFTYTVEGNVIKTSNGLDGTVSGGAVSVMNGVTLTAYDKFEGVWELSASLHKEYTFDGKGNWSYEYYGYGADGNKISNATASGRYTVSGNVIDLGNGTKLTMNADGYLVASGSVYYSKEYSYKGVWSDIATMYSIELTFDGLTVDGYGTASINYGASYGSYDLEYDVIYGDLTLADGYDANGNVNYTTYYTNKPVIYMYNNDVLIAALVYLEDENTLWGSVYLLSTGEAAIKTFYLYDDFRGDWISNSFDVTFNGLGNYDVPGNASFVGASGIATVTVSGETVRGTYSLENNTLTGEFAYGGNTYNISYDENTDTIKITQGSVTLQQRDEWYNVKLVDGNGNIYSFNGKGNIGAGVMTKTAPDGTTAELTYNASTITKSGNDFKYGATTLYVYTGFTGTWNIAGTYGQTLVIGDFNATYTAQGTFMGEALTFTYYPDGGYVTITDPDDPDALPWYVNLLDGDDVIELAISTVNNTLGEYVVCTNAESGFDEYKGEYEGGNGTLTLDGMGKSLFTDGAGKLEKDGKVVETFSYAIDGFGMVLLRSDLTGAYSLLFKTENYSEEDDVYVMNGAHYVVVVRDALYGVTADSKDGTEFVFCGNGFGTAGGVQFTYKITGIDNTLLQFSLTLTINGETDNYVVDCVVDYTTITYTISVATDEDEEEEGTEEVEGQN